MYNVWFFCLKIYKVWYEKYQKSKFLVIFKKNVIIILYEEKNFCILESFNTNISLQIFDYKITFVEENSNSKGDFGLKNRF